MIEGVRDGCPAESKNRSIFNKTFKNELVFRNYDKAQWYGGYYVQFDDKGVPQFFQVPPNGKIKISVSHVHLELYCAPIKIKSRKLTTIDFISQC
jgi:hypothetical protein